MIADADRDDLIWLSGIVEGEGCIDAQRGKYPRIRVSMIDRDVVGRVATLFGSSIRLTLKPFPKRSIWSAEVQGERAAEIMRKLLPFLGARRSSKIAEVLAIHEARKSPSWRGSAYGKQIARPPGLLSPSA